MAQQNEARGVATPLRLGEDADAIFDTHPVMHAILLENFWLRGPRRVLIHVVLCFLVLFSTVASILGSPRRALFSSAASF